MFTKVYKIGTYIPHEKNVRQSIALGFITGSPIGIKDFKMEKIYDYTTGDYMGIAADVEVKATKLGMGIKKLKARIIGHPLQKIDGDEYYF